MQLKSLHMATVIALAGVGISSAVAAPLSAMDSPSGRHVVGSPGLAEPSSSEAVRFVPLRDLATMLDKGAFASNKGVKGGDATLRRTAQTPSDGSAASTHAAVVSASSLGNPDTRAHVHDLYEEGFPVAVIRGDDPSDVALVTQAFGAAIPAKVAIYFRGRDGKIEVVGAGGDDEGLTPADLADRVATAIRLVTQGIDDVARTSEKTRNSRSAMSMATVNSTHLVPRIDMSMTRTGMEGSWIRSDITVLRDSTNNRDFKRVISRVSYQANPKDGGHFIDRFVLVIPDSYRLTQDIGRSDGARTDTVDLYPASTGSTDITFSETRQSTTSYGFNISPEIERSLTNQVPNAAAKASFGFNFGRSHTDEKSINFTLKDYYIATSQVHLADGFSRTTWNLRLADPIRNNNRYFGHPRPLNNITPMMRQGAAQTYAMWNLPGAFEGTVTVRASFAAEMRLFRPRENETRIVGWDPSSLQMDVQIDASSPFLTREPTVLIRSSVGGGRCLQRIGSGEVTLGICDTGPAARTQQWTLDEQGRYRNRSSGQCLQSNGASGGLGLGNCSADHRQRFRWVADRIHNLYNNDDTALRLVAGSGSAVTISQGTQALPPNINHALLAPWSSYPGAPEGGDTVPGFDRATPISSDWVGRYRTIPNNERWDVIPMRVGQ